MKSSEIQPEREEAAAGQRVVTPPISQPAFLKPDRSEWVRFIPIVTLVLWLSCSVVGVLGLALPYELPCFSRSQPESIQVEMLSVELTDEPLPDLQPLPIHALATPPPPEAVAQQPSLPEPIAIAAPVATVDFPVPVENPGRVVEAAQASPVNSSTQDVLAGRTAPLQVLTFGKGAGKQPAPEYPPHAEDAGQEGTVNVRFVVGENGRVVTAEAINPSPWPLLNDSAVRTIRHRWRFPSGMTRAYQVAIRFTLPK